MLCSIRSICTIIKIKLEKITSNLTEIRQSMGQVSVNRNNRKSKNDAIHVCLISACNVFPCIPLLNGRNLTCLFDNSSILFCLFFVL